MAKARSSTGTTHRFGGDWTQAKLDVLKDFMAAYAKALKEKPPAAQPFRKPYIDAFAGTGSSTAREHETSGAAETLLFSDLAEPAPQKLLDGSAQLALLVEPRFDKYIFIERSPERYAQLESLTRFEARARRLYDVDRIRRKRDRAHTRSRVSKSRERPVLQATTAFALLEGG